MLARGEFRRWFSQAGHICAPGDAKWALPQAGEVLDFVEGAMRDADGIGARRARRREFLVKGDPQLLGR